MAAYISFQPSDFFNNVIYTGTGSSNAVTGVGFQPDLTWIKSRSNTYAHGLTDSVRGVKETLFSDTDGAEVTYDYGLTVFGADGFTVISDNIFNGSGPTYASWNWKMGTTSGLTGGTITPSSYSISATAGQSIIAYTGNGVAGATIPHGLGVAPDFFIVKNLEDSSTDWDTYQSAVANFGLTPEDKYLILNASGAIGDNTFWNDTAPTSTVFSVGNASKQNESGKTYVAYCFASVKGYSKFGGYTGNGNADGAFIYTGFRPSFVLVKSTSGAGSWAMFDDKRLGYNVDNDHVSGNTTAAEQTDDTLDIVSNGFKTRNTTNQVNGSGWTYCYAAFAKNPIISSNGVPGVAR